MLGWLMGERCIVCDSPGALCCERCRAELRPPPEDPVPAGLDSLGVVLAYDGVGRELVARVKYHRRHGLVGELGAAVAARAPVGLEVVTWVPSAPGHVATPRAALSARLARAVARRVGCGDAVHVLDRPSGVAQTDRDRAQRLAGPQLVARAAVDGCCVGVVDDVVTTGASMMAAAACLRRAGAAAVHGLAVARTPQERTKDAA